MIIIYIYTWTYPHEAIYYITLSLCLFVYEYKDIYIHTRCTTPTKDLAVLIG